MADHPSCMDCAHAQVPDYYDPCAGCFRINRSAIDKFEPKKEAEKFRPAQRVACWQQA